MQLGSREGQMTWCSIWWNRLEQHLVDDEGDNDEDYNDYDGDDGDDDNDI